MDAAVQGRVELPRRPLILAGVILTAGVAATVADPSLALPAPAGWLALGLSLVVLVGLLVRAHGKDLFAPTVVVPIALLGYFTVGSLNVIPWGTVPGGMAFVVLAAVGAFVTGAS